LIDFPFVRGTQFTLGELRRFETSLLERRRADAELSAWLNERLSRGHGWVKDRSDEMIPLYKFGEHLDLPDDTGVTWQDKPDFVLNHKGGDEGLEVTTTAPAWEPGIEHGHQRAIEAELRNRNIARIGHVFSREQGQDGHVALGRVTAIGPSQRDNACVLGLAVALKRKSRSTYNTEHCTLLVYCDGYGIQTIDGEFPSIVAHAAASVARPPFARIYAAHEIKYKREGIQDMTWLRWKTSS
jgi:hypothetical protein